MIRFIDLGKQIGLNEEDQPREFAFYDTVSEQFVQLNGSQVWDNWLEFRSDWIAAFQSEHHGFDDNCNIIIENFDLDRFVKLLPPWVPR